MGRTPPSQQRGGSFGVIPVALSRRLLDFE
jgi:hypothetical protein